VGNDASGNQTRPHIEDGFRTKQPPMFKVLMHNDDYTSMDFVVEMLRSVFYKSPTEANRIMLHIHFKGVGICGVFPYEIAETKTAKVHALAQAEGYPLRCSLDRV
jgi:ATP-dependent Clp protease adaptor protein ClpS